MANISVEETITTLFFVPLKFPQTICIDGLWLLNLNKFIIHSIIYTREKMFGSKSFKNQGRSTAVSLKSSSSSVSGKKDNFFTFLYKRIYALLMKLWGKTRSMLWISSTGKINIDVGFILLIVPFSFLYLTEM